MLSDTNFLPSRCQSLSSRAQNRHFCAFLGSGTPVFRVFEHKIGVFVLFWPSGLPFSGVSSTKSRFLCAFCLRNPRFLAFRAQNRGFCAFFAFRTPVFGHFEHKIEVFVRFCPSEPPISGFLSTKFGFLCALDVGCCSSAGCDYSRGRCSDCGQGSGTDYNSGCGPGCGPGCGSGCGYG